MRLHGAHPCGGRRHMLRVLPAWDVRVARGLRWACALLLPRRLRRQNNSIECYRRSMNSKKKTTARIRRCQSMLVKRQPTVYEYEYECAGFEAMRMTAGIEILA